MTAPADDGDLSGKVSRIVIEVGLDGGCRVSVARWERSQGFFHGAWMSPCTEDYDVTTHDDLVDLVRRLVAEPPEGRAR